jgi:hypothetical protein
VGSKLCVCGFAVSLDFGFGVGDWAAWTFQVSGIGNVKVKAACFFKCGKGLDLVGWVSLVGSWEYLHIIPNPEGPKLGQESVRNWSWKHETPNC